MFALEKTYFLYYESNSDRNREGCQRKVYTQSFHAHVGFFSGFIKKATEICPLMREWSIKSEKTTKKTDKGGGGRDLNDCPQLMIKASTHPPYPYCLLVSFSLN